MYSNDTETVYCIQYVNLMSVYYEACDSIILASIKFLIFYF